MEFNNDGPRGGGPYADGCDGATAPVTNQSNTPIESIEADQPLRITRYSYVPDSGGAGKFRGGLGVIREYELTADEATMQIRSDRNKFLPWGTQGGSPGSQTHSILNPDGDRQELPSKFMMDVKKEMCIDLSRLEEVGTVTRLNEIRWPFLMMCARRK